MAQTRVLRIAAGVRWRTFFDGVVVHVAETCETHVLPAHCASLFNNAGASASSDGGCDAGLGRRPDTAYPGLKDLPDDALQALIDLKIFDRVN